MIQHRCLLSLFLVCLFLLGCSTAHHNRITQISTIDALLAGAYDGCMTLEDLSSYGTVGIGTFDKLDGEMVMLDGRIFQIKADGKAYVPESTVTAPFASVVEFESDKTINLSSATDYLSLQRIVNAEVPNMNIFCAVKVKGQFLTMKTRSVPAQEKPYPPLIDVTGNQPVFSLNGVTGTIVGFRSPQYVKGIGVPGYHLHFISDTHDSGGHVLSFKLQAGTAEIDKCNRFLMILPEESSDFSRIDLTVDRSQDLDRAEKE